MRIHARAGCSLVRVCVKWSQIHTAMPPSSLTRYHCTGTVTGMTRHGAGADGDDGASGEALDLNAIVSMTFKDGDHVDVAHSLGMYV